MSRVYRVGAFGSYWYTYSMTSALALVFSLKADYGPATRVTLASLWLATFEQRKAS